MLVGHRRDPLRVQLAEKGLRGGTGEGEVAPLEAAAGRAAAPPGRGPRGATISFAPRSAAVRSRQRRHRSG